MMDGAEKGGLEIGLGSKSRGQQEWLPHRCGKEGVHCLSKVRRSEKCWSPRPPLHFELKGIGCLHPIHTEWCSAPSVCSTH